MPGSPRVLTFHLGLTSRCNLACAHCYRGVSEHRADATPAGVQRILEKLQALRRGGETTTAICLSLAGGEPLLYAGLEDTIRHASKNGFAVRLTTNATLVDPRRAESLREAGLESVQVSVDGATEGTYSRIRGGGDWDRVVSGIRELSRVGMTVILNYVLLPQNTAEAASLLDLSNELDVAGVKYARAIHAGRLAHEGAESGGCDVIGLFEGILRRAHETGYARYILFLDPLACLLPARVPHLFTLPRVVTDMCRCREATTFDVDAVSGEMYYCRLRTPLGNIFEDDVSNVIRSAPVLEAVRARRPTGACVRCDFWESCSGGCPAVAWARTGSMEPPDPDCPFAAPDTRQVEARR